MRRGILCALAVLALAACGGPKDLAVVGKTHVTKRDYEQAVTHFRLEAQANGRSFDEASAKPHIVSLLLYRAELAEAGRRLGITVSDRDAAARVAANSSSGEADAQAQDFGFQLASARASLYYERIYLRVTRGVPAAKRDAVMRTWVRTNHAALAKETRLS